MQIGVLGGGQLGRMLALAGHPIGIRCRFLEPGDDPSAGPVGECIRGEFEDYQSLYRLAAGMDAITFEFENVPVPSAEWLNERVPVRPRPNALATAQDRVAEKVFFDKLGIPVPAFARVESRDDLEMALDGIGLPAVLKTTRFGYDGKGQAILETDDDVEAGWARLGGRSLVLEQFVPFDRELSILGVRSQRGETAFYPLVENEHRDGILRRSTAPAPTVSLDLQARAEGYARRAMDALDYVGVLAIELFLDGDELLVNEMAPRVHNSGHWTIEGAETSQFENHLRAVAGMPLGSTALVSCCEMWNLIGSLPDTSGVLAIPGAHLHLYGKSPRPGRKIGHVTIRADNPAERAWRVGKLKAVMGEKVSNVKTATGSAGVCLNDDRVTR